MEYVEMMRARRVLTWYTGSLLALLAITVISMYAGHATVGGSGPGPTQFDSVVLACALGACIVATCMAPGLIAEDATLAITWTRPEPRSNTAWRFVAVDLATIAIGYLLLCAVVVAFIALFGGLSRLVWSPGVLTGFALGLGCAVMWYGLVALVSSRLPGRGGLIAGMSWVAFIVVGTLWAAPFPAPLHALLSVANYLNPLAYIGGISGGDGHHHATHPIVLAQSARSAIEWLVAAVAIVATVRLWSTRQV